MWDNSTLQSFLTFNVIHKVQQHCGYQSNYKKVEGKPMQKRHNQQWHSQVSNKTLKKKGKQKDIKVLTTNAGAKKHFQNQVPFAVEDRPCRYGNDSESQVLNGLHTNVQRQRTHISVNIAIFIC